MTDISSHSGGFRIDPNMPMLSGADLMKEAQGMEAEVFDLGGGVCVERRGCMIKFDGGDNLSPQAMMAAIRASEMGGDAGRSMFETFRTTHPEDFDGSRTMSAFLERANRPPTPPSAQSPGRAADPTEAEGVRRVSSGGSFDAEDSEEGVVVQGEDDVEIKGSPEDDFLAAYAEARLWGRGGNDTLTAYANSTLHGGDGNDTLSAYGNSTLYGDDGDDTLSAYANSTLYGGAGNDTLSAYGNSTLYGGAGDDTLSAYGNSTLYGDDGDDTLSAYGSSTLYGGAGDDTLSAYGNSTLYGGDGNDRLEAYGNSTLYGGAGDDRMDGYSDTLAIDTEGNNAVSAYSRSSVTTGDGDDWIETYDHATVHAGDGNNMVETYDHSTVVTGAGDDFVTAEEKSMVVTGAGDDMVKVGRDSVVDAGTGNDRITVDGEATLRFARGDGHDILGGGRWGHAYHDTDRLSSSTVMFEGGITAADLTFQASGNDLVIAIAGGEDSLTLRDYQRHGIPTLSFEDGTVMTSEDVTAVVGPGDDYTPVSQVLQRWFDANAAYRAAQEEAGGQADASA